MPATAVAIRARSTFLPTPADFWKAIAIRMANEGLPVSAMARALAIAGYEVRECLDEALTLGKIIEMPINDWPPTAKKSDRIPNRPPPSPQTWLRMVDDDMLSLYCVKVFQLTPLQGAVMSVLLRHKEVTKEMIHSVIEHRRQSRATRTDMEETELKMVDVVICHIRRKMKKYNDNDPPVKTLWGSGYYIPSEFKAKVVSLIDGFEKD